MAEQKKLAWLPLIILILVIVFLLFALITTSLIIVDLKTKELTSQTLHTLEQQRNTFEISLNYELLLTRSVAEEFSKELQLDKNPENVIPIFHKELVADFLLFDNILTNEYFSTNQKFSTKEQKSIHNFIAKKSGFYGPKSISLQDKSEKKSVFAFSAPVFKDSLLVGFRKFYICGKYVYKLCRKQTKRMILLFFAQKTEQFLRQQKSR